MQHETNTVVSDALVKVSKQISSYMRSVWDDVSKGPGQGLRFGGKHADNRLVHSLNVEELRAWEAVAEYWGCKNVNEAVQSVLRCALCEMYYENGLEFYRPKLTRRKFEFDTNIQRQLEESKEAAYER